MERLGGLLAAFAILALWFVPVSAHADDEYIRHLDVTYNVQADGMVDVRYEVQWHFPEKGRHGIFLNFASRERWENDRSKDVVYELTNFRVSSPSGAPAQFTQTTEGSGSEQAESLRIGDPDVELDTQDATYVVEYSMAGALRTFDGAPQLFWDVTSNNLPPVRSFAAKVTAPEGVTRARCLVDQPHECDSEVANGEANYSHDGVPGIISVVAEFPAGSVANAEPVLQDRQLSTDEFRGIDTQIDVQLDGSAEVQHRIDMAYPATDTTQRAEVGLLVRMPWSEELDQVVELDDVVVRDEDGAVLEHTVHRRGEEGSSTALAEIQFRGAGEGMPPPMRTFDVSYLLRGAVGVDGDVARLRVSLLPDGGFDLQEGKIAVTLPAAAEEVGCVRFRFYEPGPGVECGLEATVDGDMVVVDELRELDSRSHMMALDVAFPASALTSWAALEPSLDLARSKRESLGVALGFGGAGLAVAAGVATARWRSRRDARYAGVAPGVVGTSDETRPARRGETAPVRFTPPELLVSQAGLLLDRKYNPQHLAATLVSLAVQGSVELGTRPLKVRRVSNEAWGVESRVLMRASTRDIELSKSRARDMAKRMESQARRDLKSSGWFQEHDAVSRKSLVPIASFAPAALYWLWFLVIGDPLPDGGVSIGIGLVIGGIIANIVGRRVVVGPALTAEGTALLDQVEGFKQYIKTAESHQLNFEADRDIFRRYLPWAVLFDLTDRWTKVCREWAAEGRIAEIDTSFWVGAASFSNFGREMGRFSSQVGSASRPPSALSASSGGSGGRSGFSGGSFGGGGGGGTSGGSW